MSKKHRKDGKDKGGKTGREFDTRFPIGTLVLAKNKGVD